MKETVEEFYDRVSINFNNSRVFVFPNKNRRDNAYKKGYKPEIWNFRTALNYIAFLDREEDN